MWLIVTFLVTAAATTAYVLLRHQREKYKLGLLTMMLWGTFLMVLVDHLIAFMHGEKFIEVTTGGLIKSGTLLGIMMVVPICLIWIIAISKPFGHKSQQI